MSFQDLVVLQQPKTKLPVSPKTWGAGGKKCNVDSKSFTSSDEDRGRLNSALSMEQKQVCR